MEMNGLSEFQRDLLKTATNMPKEVPKVMRKIGSMARTNVARKARLLVKKQTGTYHKRWKRGKVFKGADGEWIVRVYNSSPHAHLIEDGHRMVNKDGQEVGFVRGRKPLEKGMQDFDSSGVNEQILSVWLDELLESGKL